MSIKKKLFARNKVRPLLYFPACTLAVRENSGILSFQRYNTKLLDVAVDGFK